MKRSTKRIIGKVIGKVIRIMLLPSWIVYLVLKRLGVASYIESKIAAKLQQKEAARADLRDKVATKLHCSNVSEYPAFWVGSRCAGYYRAGRIVINANTKGIDMVETLFHEDRHYQQEQRNRNCFKGYIAGEDDYKGYIRQHVEKDARRYAYVQTMRYAKEIFTPVRFYIFAPLYRLRSHPWKGLVLKKYRTK